LNKPQNVSSGKANKRRRRWMKIRMRGNSRNSHIEEGRGCRVDSIQTTIA